LGTTIGYCLYNGSYYVSETGSLVVSNDPISIEASLQDGKLVSSGHVTTDVSLYWPNFIQIIRDEYGKVINFSRNGDMILLTVQSGSHIFTIK
jgi:hypothetical protein